MTLIITMIKKTIFTTMWIVNIRYFYFIKIIFLELCKLFIKMLQTL
jgi:hypothetical protein